MSEWKEITLGEILELITDYHSNGSYETLKENVELLDQKDFAIMIRTTNFEQNDFSENQKSSAPRGGVWKSFARKPLVSIASLYFSPQGAGNYTHTRLKSHLLRYKMKLSK